METKYNAISSGYNITRQADPYLTGRLVCFLKPEPGDLFLDIGCGTGNYTIALSNLGLNFTGVDPSENMLQEARKRSGKISWLKGSAECLPVIDDTFNSVIATLTIHHWTDLEQSFKEIHRVTKENGTVVLFTATPEQMNGYWLNYYFPEMLKSSIDQMPAMDSIKDALTNSGFELITTEKYFVHEDLRDHFLYSGKYQPKLYFNETIRKGIASFSALANVDEVEKGLSKLSEDIETGKFIEIQNRYNNEHGDYLFIEAKSLQKTFTR
ncbi:MAG: mraW [Mucilaginibacter sp.]|nr:mraW [Mucilaginibacter sp.]